MAFIELTENNVVKSKILINTSHIVKVEPRGQGKGSIVYTSPKADGNNAIPVTEGYETVRARLLGDEPEARPAPHLRFA